MKRLTLALLLAVPVAIAGCQDNASLQSDVSLLKAQVAMLQDDNEQLRNRPLPIVDTTAAEEVEALRYRLEQAEQKLEATENQLAELRKTPAPATVEAAEEANAPGDSEYEGFKAMQERLDAERRAERNERRAEQMQEWAKVAKENGLEFDAENPRASIQRIMMDPVQRAKAFEAMRTEMNNRRLGALGLDDYQMREVQRIETETRQKVRDAMAGARETGATQEEVAQQVQSVRKEQEDELKRVLTPEQYEEYEKSAAAGMIPPNLEGLGGMFPPGTIPGGE